MALFIAGSLRLPLRQVDYWLTTQVDGQRRTEIYTIHGHLVLLRDRDCERFEEQMVQFYYKDMQRWADVLKQLSRKEERDDRIYQRLA